MSPSLRPLLARPLLVVPLALAPLIGVGAVAFWPGGDDRAGETAQGGEAAQAGGNAAAGDDGEQAAGAKPAEPPPPRPLSDGDVEVPLGESTAVAGIAVSVTKAEMAEVRPGRQQLLVFVELANEADEPLAYSALAFTAETESGLVLAPLPYGRDDMLERGTLAPGERLTGTIAFDAGPGTHRILFNSPDPDRPSRAVWTVTA